jgi:hypothetical protein
LATTGSEEAAFTVTAAATDAGLVFYTTAVIYYSFGGLGVLGAVELNFDLFLYF